MTFLALLGSTLGHVATQAETVSPALWPDTYLGRVEAYALVETLNAKLLAARSATFTLDQWCADHHMAEDPKIRARLVKGAEKPISAEQRQRLQVADGEIVKYRRVELACGDHILSEADNWYVPSRLTTEMNILLETTDTPFGRAVQELKPYRQTFAVELHWHSLPDGWEMSPPLNQQSAGPLAIPPVLFEHRALLFTADRKPFSEVDEHYTSEILAFARSR
jgi:hypothetical protein